MAGSFHYVRRCFPLSHTYINTCTHTHSKTRAKGRNVPLLSARAVNTSGRGRLPRWARAQATPCALRQAAQGAVSCSVAPRAAQCCAAQRCSVLQTVVLQSAAVWCRVLQCMRKQHLAPCDKLLKVQCVAVCCSVLQCVAVYDSVLQCVAVCWMSNDINVSFDTLQQCVAGCCRVLQCAAECCRVLQCAAECCRVLQSVAVCCRVLQGAAECPKRCICHDSFSTLSNETFMSWLICPKRSLCILKETHTRDQWVISNESFHTCIPVAQLCDTTHSLVHCCHDSFRHDSWLINTWLMTYSDRTYIYIGIYLHVYRFRYMYICVCMYIYIYIYKYIYIYMYKCMYIYVYTYVNI